MAGSSANEKQARVIRFWQAVEVFSPQVIPAGNPFKNVYETGGDGLLPWDSGHPLRKVELSNDLTWRHCVYAGIFDVQRVIDLLEDKFGADAESFDARPPGHSALLALTVTDEGRRF